VENTRAATGSVEVAHLSFESIDDVGFDVGAAGAAAATACCLPMEARAATVLRVDTRVESSVERMAIGERGRGGGGAEKRTKVSVVERE
jgi:hypothetical protein